MLDSYELNKLMHESYGDKSDEKVQDNLFTGPLDFARFYTEAFQKDEQMAYLILTGNQYVFARNHDNGRQGHILSITKAFLEMEGKNPDVTLLQASRLYSKYDKNFLIFSIEIRKGDRKYEQLMRAMTRSGTISPEEYNSFKVFYDTYRDALKKSNLSFNLWNSKVGKYVPIKNIDKLNDYLFTMIDVNAKPFDLGVEEKIIGVQTNYMAKSNENKKKI